jgi:hypothetical protein
LGYYLHVFVIFHQTIARKKNPAANTIDMVAVFPSDPTPAVRTITPRNRIKSAKTALIDLIPFMV